MPPPTASAVSLDGLMDACFSAYLMGAAQLSTAPMNAEEHRCLALLKAMRKDPSSAMAVPRLPTMLPRLISLCHQPGLNTAALADLLAKDPALLGRVIQLANSSFYRPNAHGAPIQSMHEAVAMIGMEGIKQVTVQVVLAPLFDTRHGPQANAASTLWKQTEYSAQAAAWLTTNSEARFNAYLAGMVSGTGLLLLLRTVERAHIRTHELTSQAFHSELNRLCYSASAMVARHWSFPEDVQRAVSALRRATPSTPLGQALALGKYLALRLADHPSLPDTSGWSETHLAALQRLQDMHEV